MAGEKTAKRQVVGYIDGLPGPWAVITGGERTVDVTTAFDGGAKRGDKIPGIPQAANLIYSRPFQQDRDQAVQDLLVDLVGSFTSTCSRIKQDRNGQAVGKAETFPNALLVRCSPPEGEAGSGDAAMIELEFAPSDWA